MDAFVTVYRQRPAFVEIWLRGRSNQAIREYGRAHNLQVAGLHPRLRAASAPDEAGRADRRDRRRDRRPPVPARLRADIDGDPTVLGEAVKVVTTYLELYATHAGLRGRPP